MPKLRDRTGDIPDKWQREVRNANLPHIHDLASFEALESATPELTGVEIENDVDVAALPAIFDRVSLISIRFPSFADGRGFSIARQVRAMGYSGRLRAHGPLIADQFDDLLACGFDEVEIPDAMDARQPHEQWDTARGIVKFGYQNGYAGRKSILEARRSARTGI